VIYLAGSQPGWDQPSEWFPEAHGYPSELLSAWQRSRSGRAPMTVARGIGHALSRSRAECVVSWEFGPATLRALAWGRRRGVPVLVFSELTEWSEAGLTALQRRMHQALAPRVDGFVVASSQGLRRLGGMGIDGEKVEVAVQSADVEGLRASAVEAGGRPASSAAIRVLAVGRLVPDKNLPALVAAFAEAGFSSDEAELEIRGSGPIEAELRAQAERLGAAVTFPGAVPPGELGAVYGGADALVLVSTYEPFGVTLREGAAAGLPLIASERAGAVGDVAVDGENAIVIDPANRAQLVEALRRVVREPDLRARLAAGSRAVTERHPPEADAEAWERAILGAISRRAPSIL
jgi:glycosyltransferase involved in cell wall biosynthesis